MTRTLIRPIGFVDSPFGHDGKVARLAGGLSWFAQVELIHDDGARELVPVAGIEDRFDEAMAADWARLTGPRAPLVMGSRTIRLDQPQVMAIVNATPDIGDQIEAHPDLHPGPGARQTPVAGVVLTDAELDHTLGLWRLREADRLEIVATAPVREAVEAKGIDTVSAAVAMIPGTYVTLTGREATQMVKLMEALEDHDDVQHVWSNADIEEKEIEASLA